MKYLINKTFNSKISRTPRVLEIAESFGLGLSDKEFVIYQDFEIEVCQGDVVYITGQSGSGKSLLLRELSAQMQLDDSLEVVDVDKITWCEDTPLIDQIGKSTDDANRLLGIAGLSDANLFTRSPAQLSDGQKYRFALAKMIESGANVWVADEFGAKLDRITAKVVAFAIQKIARKLGATLIVATTHTDLLDELGPTLMVEKRYMNKITTTRFKNDA